MLRKYSAKYAIKKVKGTTLLHGAWGPQCYTGELADAIVSRIQSHYVVTIIKKPITLEQRVSAVNMHLKELSELLRTMFAEGVEKLILIKLTNILEGNQ